VGLKQSVKLHTLFVLLPAMASILQFFQGLLKLFCRPSDTEPDQQQGEQSQSQAQAQPQQLDEQHKPSYPSSRPHRPQQYGGDQNQLNQQNEHYVSLRARANEEGNQMAQSFEASHEAYERRDGALAKELSNKGKEHQRRMEGWNQQASDWVFAENNKDSKPGEIDLHGLYVKEAIVHTDQAIQEAKQRGDSEIRLIVGKGLHSPGGAAKIKPAIEQLMQNHQLLAEMDPDNAGVLIVHMDRGGHDSREVSADEIMRRLHKDEGCTIM